MIILIITFVMYLVIDLISFMFFPFKSYQSHLGRLTSPSYINEPYFSEKFLTESFIQPNGWVTPKNTKLLFPDEFHGKYFNVDKINPVKSTYRRTINKYKQNDNVAIVLLLGGSTVYNSEVPDEFTIASIISEKINASSPNNFLFFNAGVTSVNSLQEVARLKYELAGGLNPEIVIVFNGVNDIIQGVYCGNPEGVMFPYSPIIVLEN